ncbi:hypothetical protein INT47_012284 [Mucor saturninus]|uniref:RRM domain-containing protein n=1 Tax=Mucor saturninus TaxID=64648 RepID=A0A8H7V210_9FUNG|nr:hypothetical protein INT47_012284 [Mucor saturninus]
MTEPNGNDTAIAKKSVVDDFFSALFANNTTVSDDNTPANNSTTTTTTTTTTTIEAFENKAPSTNQDSTADGQDYKYKYNPEVINNDNEQDESNIMDEEEQSNHGGRKRERVLDEFDEYSLLSKRRGSDRSKNNFKRKAIEARESIQDVNQNADIDNIKIDRQILSKRDIDWSTVKPESRMLVRQLPKFIDKQDVMNYFSKYGEVLEVVQKTPFGFVHFENPEACAQAVQVENGKPFHGIVLDLEICKRKPFFARAAERDVREPNAREPAPVEESPRNANVRRNSVQKNFDPRARGVRQEQYDPYNARNASPPAPPLRFQQSTPPPPPTTTTIPRRRADNNRNMDRGRNNDYRPDYGRNQPNDYGRQNDFSQANRNDFNGGRNQQNDYGRQQQQQHQQYQQHQHQQQQQNHQQQQYHHQQMQHQEENRGYNNNNNSNNYNRGNADSGRNSYNPRYNDQPMNGGRNSYNPRYNEATDDGRNSYVPRYNDAPYAPRFNEIKEEVRSDSYTPRYNAVKEEVRSDSYTPRYNDVKEEGRGYVPRYNDPMLRSPTRNYTTAAPVVPSLPVPLIPARQGNEVPTVQIVAWDNVAYGYTDYIERVFSSNHIRASSITLPYTKESRESIVKQMILEGVKAIVMIDRHNEFITKIYLQVFAPAENGQGVRYDEYDSVTAIEAVSIIRRAYPQTPIAPPPPPQAPAIDMNTLASLYNMIQPKSNGTVASPAVNNQPTIPQLLATLVNGLNVNATPTMMPASLPPPPPPQQQQQQQQQKHQLPEQPNIAALISTAANGNPALAQLLAQMTATGITPQQASPSSASPHVAYSPSVPNSLLEPTLGYPSSADHQPK